MSNLPGNPYEEEAKASQITDGALVHALMAVAFEIRTRNIIAVNKSALDALDGLPDVPADVEAAMNEQADLITARLGGTP